VQLNLQNKKMKIAIVSSTFLPTINGVTIHIKSLVRGLEAEGHDVYVVSPRNGKERFCKHDLRIASIYNPFSKLYPLSFSYLIPREIKDIKFDIVHLHHPIGVYGLAKKISKKSDCPFIFTNHTQYLAYINYYTAFFRGFVKKFMLARLKKLYGEASVVIGSTEEVKDEILKINPAANVQVIPVGFDESRLEAKDNPGIRKQIGVTGSDFLALYVGRVSKEKNIDVLLETADKVGSLLPNFKLAIVGPGDYLETAKKTIPSNVIVVGQPTDDDLAALYKHCDLFLSASTSETLSLTFSEAGYCGAPLLGMDSLGIRDVVTNNENGLLAKDQNDFKEKLVEMVNNRQMLEKFRQNAPILAIKYSAKYNLKKIIDVYKNAGK
jgi:glycosyltransferase involved in cell wall biosynthesis